jgi:hypothetical protein
MVDRIKSTNTMLLDELIYRLALAKQEDIEAIILKIRVMIDKIALERPLWGGQNPLNFDRGGDFKGKRYTDRGLGAEKGLKLNFKLP